MTTEERKTLLKAQQGELDAVILYRKLAEISKDKSMKEEFLKVAADEGNHAAILRGYTGAALKPKSAKANFVSLMYKVLGSNFTMNLLAKGELKSIDKYNPLVQGFPNIKKIIKDEAKHAEITRSFIKK